MHRTSVLLINCRKLSELWSDDYLLCLRINSSIFLKKLGPNIQRVNHAGIGFCFGEDIHDCHAASLSNVAVRPKIPKTDYVLLKGDSRVIGYKFFICHLTKGRIGCLAFYEHCSQCKSPT